MIYIAKHDNNINNIVSVHYTCVYLPHFWQVKHLLWYNLLITTQPDSPLSIGNPHNEQHPEEETNRLYNIIIIELYTIYTHFSTCIK